MSAYRNLGASARQSTTGGYRIFAESRLIHAIIKEEVVRPLGGQTMSDRRATQVFVSTFAILILAAGALMAAPTLPKFTGRLVFLPDKDGRHMTLAEDFGFIDTD